MSKDNFCHLHCHSTYSFLDGYGHPSEHIAVAKELGQKAIAVTDHGNISAHYKWYTAAVDAGIKPILGCEFYVVDDVSKKERKRYHITVLPKNLEGYKNLIRLVTKSYSDGFYYKPRVDWEMLKKHKTGLIGTSGCPSSKTSMMIRGGGYSDKDIIDELKRQKECFEDYYIELQPLKFNDGKIVTKKMYKIAKDLDWKTFMTMDSHYPKRENYDIHDVLLCVQTNKKYEDPERMKFDSDEYFIKSRSEMENLWNKLHPELDPKDALDCTSKIVDEIDFEFPTAKPIKYPYNGNKFEYLKQICKEGIEFRKLKMTDEYKKRLDRELNLIKEKDFIDYFLVIIDMIRYAKDNDIMVGPARGSSAGSLVCYLTRITDIDPLKYDLLFERFIAVNRDDLPDIDIDFQDDRREEVKKYLEEKYGYDKVATLGTFGTFKGKLCVQDIGRVFELPISEINEVKKLMLERSGGDSRASLTVADTFENFEKVTSIVKKHPELNYAKQLEGQVRHMGVHAAGVVVSNEPIENFAALYRSSNEGKVLSMDYHDAEAVGLLKIDILGLNTLTNLSKMKKLVKERAGKDVNLLEIDLEDKKVLEAFASGKLFGVFQFDGQAMMQVCKQVKPENFEELAAVNALSRPGPLHSGGTTNYIERKFGKQKITHLHPLIENLTKTTYGVVIYQEQVMRIVREIGKFSWGETSTIRKAMSKSLGEEFFRNYEDKFVEGAKENGVDEETARNIFGSVYTFGSWAFNKSHSVSYTLLGYWLMWFKVYHPMEFYAAMAEGSINEDKVRKVLKEYQSEGNVLLPVDVNRSDYSFAIDDDKLRVGFVQIKGVGSKTAEKIVKNKPFSSVADFKKRGGSKKVTETLLKIGAFRDLKYGEETKQLDLFSGSLQRNDDLEDEYINPGVEVLTEYCPIMIQDKVREEWLPWCDEFLRAKTEPVKAVEDVKEKRVMGIIGRTKVADYNLKNVVEESLSKGGKFEIERGKTQSDYDFMNFDIEDETDYVTVRISYKMFKHYKQMMFDVKPTDVLLAYGIVTEGRRMMFSYGVVNLTVLKDKLENDKQLTKIEKDVVKDEYLV